MPHVTGGLRSTMRRALDALLTDTCTITAEAVGADEYGAPPGAWSIVAANVPCRVIMQSAARSAEAGAQAGREGVADTYRLIVPAGTALDAGQRVTTSDGAVYEVVDLQTALTDAPDAQAIITRMR